MNARPIPLQNRVRPDGEIVAEPWRGGFMGNRGCLHDADGRLGRARWRHATWVCCRLEFRGRWRPVMPPPGSPTIYTALFFWDEAAAFAAGHRPCGECRNADYRRFRMLWEAAGLPGGGARAIDRALHGARITRDRRQRTHRRDAAGLADGTFVRIGDDIGVVADGALHPWLARGGYGGPQACPEGPVEVLTPAPVVAVFAAGYRPVLRIEAV